MTQLLEEILAFNREFVAARAYEAFVTSKFPTKKLAILTCMDTRLIELLPHAMNLRNGDAKIIKSAGAVVSHPFGSIMRSILVAVYELDADEICVVGHHDCGMSSIDPSATLAKMKNRGIDSNTIETLENGGIDLKAWLHGFNSVEDSVRGSVRVIRAHPLLTKSVPVHGMVIDPRTGALDLVVDGYTSTQPASPR